MARRTQSIDVKKMFYAVRNETIVKEDHWYFQRFYPDDRVRLRGSEDRTKGTVERSCQEDDGGTLVKWDDRGGRIYLHNPCYLENVWLDENNEEED